MRVLSDFFDRIYVISLPNKQREAAMRRQLDALGLNAQFVYARCPVDGFSMSNMRRNSRLEFGCNLSHLKAIQLSAIAGDKHPLFLEDDVVFKDPAQLLRILPELPHDWAMFYLGGHPRGPCRMAATGWATVEHPHCFAEAYCLSSTARNDFLGFWCDRIGQPNAMFDFVLGEFASRRKSYCTYPLMTWQPPGWSQIGGREDDKSRVLEKGWTNNLKT